MSTALAEPESRAARLRLVVILGALSAFGPLSIDMYLPGLPELARDLGTSPSAVQLTLTACLAGLAFGQVLAGPLSDRLGRRRPLLCGIALYAVTSALCATAPSVAVLTGLRLLQGFAGAAGIVIARAVVRDLHSGAAAARFFSTLMLVNGIAPILAPVLGAQLLKVTSWRGVFIVLAVVGALLLAMTALGLRETLPPERRRAGGVRETARTLWRLARDPSFMGFALAAGLVFGSMFAYIAGSPFVVQDIYGGSPQGFSAIFAVNGVGIVVASQVAGRLVGRYGPMVLLRFGLIMCATGGVVLLAVFAVGGLGLWAVLPPLFVSVSSVGVVLPNASALALADHPEVAGSASALLGVLQFAIGAVAAPLVGIAGKTTALPMGIIMAGLGIAALTCLTVLARPRPAIHT
ncbi:MAG TPA: Bcr/CflA family multidrug efflux MFS transporter [Solirubrobacteraceae bacterium]